MRHAFGLLILSSMIGGCTELEPDAASDNPIQAEVGPDGESPPVPSPAGGEDWDTVGAFQIIDNGLPTTIRLYVADTDSIAEKQTKRDEIGFFHYPNSFALHAFYRVGGADWSHREVIAMGRTRFVRVVGQDGGSVTLELRRAFQGDLSASKETLEPVRNANAPFKIRLTIRNGTPVTE